ncbi:putative GNAT family acetyltransferase [Metarhizium anisopliae]
MEYSVQLIQPDEAGVDLFLTRYKPFRLAALQNDPSFFASTYTREVSMADDFWRGRLLNPNAKTFVAIQKHDGDILSSVTIVRNVSVPQGVKSQLRIKADHEATQQVSHWEVNAVYTAPGARRRGLGRRVVEAAAKEAREVADSEGKPCLITVLVKKNNAAARILYERAGFQVLGEDDGDDALRLFLWTAR